MSSRKSKAILDDLVSETIKKIQYVSVNAVRITTVAECPL